MAVRVNKLYVVGGLQLSKAEMDRGEYHDVLLGIYQNVVSWLHFAEAKNAALVTLSSGIIFAVATVYSQLDPPPPMWVCVAMIWVCTLNFIAAVFAVLSFFPQLTLFKWSGQKTGTGDSIHYYGDIARMGLEQFLVKLSVKSENDRQFTLLERDLAQQIVVNSKIAVKKYDIFVVAMNFFIAGTTTPIGWIVVRLFLIKEVH
jgi:hypothetical protein